MEWFKQWFNEDYLDLYQHRDSAEAEKQVRFLFSHPLLLHWNADDIGIDVACGAGRHIAAMQNASRMSYGVDLSETLLRNSDDDVKSRICQGDIRHLPFRSSRARLVSSFFTSFGYFASVEEEKLALLEFHRVLRPGGVLFLDLANLAQVRATLVPSEHIEIAQGTAKISRAITSENGQTRVKKTIVLNKVTGEQIVHVEDVHLFEPDEIRNLLEECSFRTLELFGDFDGGDYSPSSQRLLLFAEKL